MPRILCDHVIGCLTREFGAAHVVGALHRWAIAGNGAKVAYVVGIDRCDSIPVRVWLFDPMQPGLKSVIEYFVNGQDETETTVQRIRDRIHAAP